MLGFVFGIVSAAFFGMSVTTTRRGVLTGTITQGLYMSILLGVPLFAIASLASGQMFQASVIPLSGYLFLMAAGILHFMGGRYCNYRAIRAIGANRMSTIGTIQLPYSVIVAFIFLGEGVSLLMGLGIFLILIGPFVIYERKDGRRTISGGSDGQSSSLEAGESTGKASAPPLVLRQAEGYLFGVLGAVAYGTSPVFIRAALQSNNLGVFGGLIAYSAAGAMMLLVLAAPGRVTELRRMNKPTFGWFSASTVTVFFAQMFRFVALGIAPVAVVATLQRMHILFVYLFSFLMNRHLESFGSRIIAGILISVTGAVLLALGRT